MMVNVLTANLPQKIEAIYSHKIIVTFQNRTLQQYSINLQEHKRSSHEGNF